MSYLWRRIVAFLRPLPIIHAENPTGILECTPEGFKELDFDELQDSYCDTMETRAFRLGWVNFTIH